MHAKLIYFDVDLDAWANLWSIALPWAQCAGTFLGIIGRDPSVSESNQLHVDIFRFFLSNLKYIL